MYILDTVIESFPGYGSRGGGDVPFALIPRISKRKYLRTKGIYTQLQILQVRIPHGGRDVCSYGYCVFSGTYLCFGSIIRPTRSTVCVFVLVCVCVCQCESARTCIIVSYLTIKFYSYNSSIEEVRLRKKTVKQ